MTKRRIFDPSFFVVSRGFPKWVSDTSGKHRPAAPWVLTGWAGFLFYRIVPNGGMQPADGAGCGEPLIRGRLWILSLLRSCRNSGAEFVPKVAVVGPGWRITDSDSFPLLASEHFEHLFRQFQKTACAVRFPQADPFAGNAERFEQGDRCNDVGRKFETADLIFQLVQIIQKRVVGRSQQVAAVQFENPLAVAVGVLSLEVK